MQKNILFIANSNKSWLGGVYYVRNQIEQLLSYAPARKNLKIYLYTSQKNKKEYADLSNYKNVCILFTEDISKRIPVQIGKGIYESLDMDIIYLVLRYNISFIFPYFPIGRINKFLLLKRSISWIPDFQHIHLPHLFSKAELKNRDIGFGKIAREHNKLVLSSRDSYKDYIGLYNNYKKNVYIIPFCSALDKRIVEQNNVDKVKLKYGINGKYYIICNQFWSHKNHMIVFKALKSAMSVNPKITIVCTGNMNAKGNRKYISEIKEYIDGNGLNRNVHLLGLVDKSDQIQLLKGAVALIQPSLFEGWGTCVEDAKALNKIILLSDIAVHHEQMNEYSYLFNPNEPDELKKLILELWNQKNEQVKTDDYYIKNAPKYGRLFYKMLLY